MPVSYPKEIKEQMIAKLLSSNGPSVIQLSKESGISESALYKWLKLYKNNVYLQGNTNMADDQNSKPIRPQNWSAEAKLNAIIATAPMTKEEVGTYCRSNGIYLHHLDEWKNKIIAGLKPSVSKEKLVNKKLTAENKALKSDLNRKDKALAETSALLVLKKKADLIWGVQKDDT